MASVPSMWTAIGPLKALIPMGPHSIPTAEATRARFHLLGSLPAGDPGKVRLRAAIIEDHLPLARRLAAGFKGRGSSNDDLIQTASLALVKAVDGYDPDRGFAFHSYATPTIRGALKHHLRDSVWAATVPRSVKELTLGLTVATNELRHRLRREPTRAELAAHLGVDASALRAANQGSLSFQAASLNEMPAAERLGGVDRGYESVEDRLVLTPLLERLPRRTRRILGMHRILHMSQAQIGDVMGLSQMQISRILRQAVTQLRDQLTSSR